MLRVFRYPALNKAYRLLWSGISNFQTSSLKDAEIEVGYSASFLGLKCLISDEFSTIVSYVRQLMNSNHPLIGTFGKLLTGGKESQQTYGLLLLLLCKLASSENVNECSPEKTGALECGLYQEQRDIAELAEMMFVGFAIHYTIQDVRPADLTEKEYSDVITGNKLGVLIGDFILAKVSTGAAETEMPHVVEEISLAVAEASEGNFLKAEIERPRNSDTVALTRDHYERVQNLCISSPFSRFMRSAMMVAGYPQGCVERTVRFSRKLVFALQCIKEFKDHQNSDSSCRKKDSDYPSGKAAIFLPCSLTSIKEYEDCSSITERVEAYCQDQITTARHLLAQYPPSKCQQILFDVLKLR